MTVAAAVLLAMALLVVAAACGDSDDGDSAGPAAGAEPKAGGTLKVGMQPGNGQYDPVMMAGAVGDIILVNQVQENLVDLDLDFSVAAGLAESWDSPDGKSWTFTLHEGVMFSNGEAFTSDDVVYSFERLRGKDSPMAEVYGNIDDVVAVDPTHVTFELKLVDSEFPAAITDYRAKMLCKSVEDPMTELVGTGPFTLESYTAEDRAVLAKNATYWDMDENGMQLPYLDGIEFIYSPDTAGQVEGLQGGALNWVGGLSSEQKQAIEANSSLKIITSDTNYHFELQIRCDEGPGKDLAVRQALMAGTDRQAIVDLVAPGVAKAGNGTLVGPAYAAYYSEDQIAFDPEKAKQLLAEAGYADGLKIELVAQSADPIPGIATAWQAQMKDIGVEVGIKRVPPDVFYADEGTETWYEAEFCYVDWGTRAIPLLYFQLALTSTAPWNYSRWENAEFDEVVKQIPQALDDAARADLYKQAQTILQTEVPMISFLITAGVAGESSNVQGIDLHPDWAHTTFRTANLTD